MNHKACVMIIIYFLLFHDFSCSYMCVKLHIAQPKRLYSSAQLSLYLPKLQRNKKEMNKRPGLVIFHTLRLGFELTIGSNQIFISNFVKGNPLEMETAVREIHEKQRQCSGQMFKFIIILFENVMSSWINYILQRINLPLI